ATGCGCSIRPRTRIARWRWPIRAASIFNPVHWAIVTRAAAPFLRYWLVCEWKTEESIMRVLLTGGYGCIGSWIARNLLAHGDQAWIYDLKEDPRRLRLILPEEQVRQVRFVQGDVTDLAGLTKAIAQHGITHLVHLAGLQVPT